MPTWTAVRSAVEDLVGSYNRTTNGQRFPATVRSQAGDRAVIISCVKGLATDAFNNVTIAIKVSALEGEYYEILVVTETWLSRQGHELLQESTSTDKFIFDGDIETQQVWLVSSSDRRLSAFQCAELFLVAALS